MIRPDKRRYATVKKRLALDENTVRPTDRQLGNFKFAQKCLKCNTNYNKCPVLALQGLWSARGTEE